ncbi:uncharacterized protein LOC142939234 [Anarhichas minor]|uniref:uncharacterized protein LOC142939234 n=1 Tax=Anarhichas minor TaxID=65739 RepID=UPI003F7339D0
MNPYGNSRPLTFLPSDPHDITHNAPLSATPSSLAAIQTGHSSVSFLSLNSAHYRTSPASFQSRLPRPTLTPPPPPPPPPPTCHVSVIFPSPDLRPSPLGATQCAEVDPPDLECSICFSQFNNVFRCPKMLQCKHTFCLECLARINVKSAEPDAIRCPLCRSHTALPALGLPRLATNSDMLSYLPAAMQRVYSIRFLRNKGKLQVKRSSEGRERWIQRSLTSLRSERGSLDVGLPTTPPGAGGSAGSDGGLGEALFRLTGRPACRFFLLTSVVLMLVLLTGIIVFLFVFPN